MQESFNKFSETYLLKIRNNIKKYRCSNNLSQEKLAELIDCSREFINRLENHKEKPSLDLLLRCAFCFKIPLEDLTK